MRETRFKQTEIGEIPEDWEVTCIGDIADGFSYGVGAEAVSYNGVDKYIRITDIDDDSHQFSPQPLMSPAFYFDKNIVQKNDILFARTGASVGKTYLYNENDGRLIFAGFLMKVHVKEDSSQFVFYNTLLQRYNLWIQAESMRTGQPGINLEQLKTFKLPLPQIAEQERIAKALSDVDGLLRELDGVIAKKRAIKQGAMQELLTGKRRLEGFEGEWKSHPFRDFYKYAAEGGTPNTSIKAYYENGKVPFVKIEDTTRKYIYESKSFITEEGLRHASAWLVPENSIIFTNGATIGNVSINKIPVSTKQGILGIIPSDIIDLEFMYYLLSNSIFQKEVEARETKGTFATIILPRLNEIVSFIPKDKAEQSAIATILSEMDADIEALEAKRAKYEQLKQGMMQELLTGRIRLV